MATRRDKWIALAVCLALVGIYAGLRQLPTPLEAAGPSSTALQSRVLLMLRALGDYSRLMLFPSNLHMERTVETSGSFLSLAGALAAGALAYGASRRGKAQPIRALGAVWFALGFLPVSNLFPLNATVAEHWLYLPSVGFLIFIVGCSLEMPARTRSVLVATACLAVLGLGARSFVRSGDWLNPETFYRHALRAGATKTRMALNLAQIYAERGDYAKAEPLLRKVVDMNPDYPHAHNALGHLLLSQGNRQEAEKAFAVATKLSAQAGPGQQRTWAAAFNTASMYFKDRDFAAACAVLEKARAEFPGTWPLIKLQAEVLQAAQRNDEAVSVLEEFSRRHWWHSGAAISLGRAHLEAGRLPEAAITLRHASRLDVHDAESLNLLALVNVRQGQLQDAYATQRRAISRQPDQPRQYLLLADILGKMGRPDEAKAALAQVTRLQVTLRDSVAN